MWILCGELQTLYAGEFSQAERSLIGQAGRLAGAWGDVRTDRGDEGSPGLWNAWATFEGLVQEIAGISGRYDGAEWVTNAVTQPWWDANHRGPGPIWIDPNAELADDGPTAKALVVFQHVVDEVTRAASEGDWEPRRLRAQIFRGQ
jgi:hypothetical protein